ncbi:MAG: hypothetical protein U5K54_05390 [Cytophagales bacterium]|nr:hypothetical protein [Cytophagales bacterium]
MICNPSLFLLNRQFILLAFVAFCLAAPLSWWLITTWYLKDFTYKATIGWGTVCLEYGCRVATRTTAQ